MGRLGCRTHEMKGMGLLIYADSDGHQKRQEVWADGELVSLISTIAANDFASESKWS